MAIAIMTQFLHVADMIQSLMWLRECRLLSYDTVIACTDMIQSLMWLREWRLLLWRSFCMWLMWYSHWCGVVNVNCSVMTQFLSVLMWYSHWSGFVNVDCSVMTQFLRVTDVIQWCDSLNSAVFAAPNSAIFDGLTFITDLNYCQLLGNFLTNISSRSGATFLCLTNKTPLQNLPEL